MSDKIKESIYRKQKTAKPRIDDVIPDYLEGDMKKTALDFAAYIQEHKMKPVWTITNSWKVNYKGKCICYIRIWADKNNHYGPPGTSWVITPYLEHMNKYEELLINGALQNIIWDSVFFCVHGNGQSGKGCNPNKPCVPGKNITLLGKEIKGICRTRPLMWFFDPDEAAIHCIKTLLEFEEKARMGNV